MKVYSQRMLTFNRDYCTIWSFSLILVSKRERVKQWLEKDFIKKNYIRGKC